MSTPTVTNYYSCLDDDNDDDKTIITSNCTSTESNDTDHAISHLGNEETMCNLSTIQIPKHLAIADAGATSHFLVKGAPVSNIKPTTTPLRINLPDGGQLKSTHTATIDIPWLPKAARQAHIVPGLSHASLISIKSLCDAGCVVTYTHEHCNVEYNKKLVWQGTREQGTGLWVLPLNEESPIHSTRDQDTKIHQTETAYNVHALTSKASVIKFLHQCLFSPPKTTLLKAVENNQLPTWPGFTAEAIKKYLPESSPATDKGHMKRQRQGIRSTKEKVQTALETFEYEQDMNPPLRTEELNQLFCFTGRVDPKTGTVYTDFTGKFPLRSIDGMTTIFILYDWSSNAILATPVTDVKDSTIVKTFQENVEYLTKRGFKPSFNIIDNVASKTVQSYLQTNDIKIQLVEPHNHRVNAAERAIQTFKNHLIAGFCTIDTACPATIWSKFIQQAQDSLNMLRTSRVHPKLSAYNVLEGTHDFNKVPWCPIGTRATIFNPPETRTSWGTRALDAFYISPAPQHYRCWQFFVPSTGGVRISGQATFYPQHCEIPRETPADEARRNAEKLIQAIQKLKGDNNPLPHRHTAALEQLSTIFKEATEQMIGEPTTEPPTSHNPTNPNEIRQAPRTHSWVTRHNTPGILAPTRPRTVGEVGTSEGELRTSEGEGTTQRSEGGHQYQPAPHKERETTTSGPQREQQHKRRSPRLNQQDEAPTPVYTTPPQKRQRIQLQNPRIITQEALNFLATHAPTTNHPHIEHYCAAVIHPTTGEVFNNYRKLAKDKEIGEIWQTAFGKEFGGLAQGDNRTGKKGTDTFHVMSHDEIRHIPKDRTIAYAKVVVDYRPQKEDPNRVRITFSGSNHDSGDVELTTRTADLTVSKILWNSVVSTRNAKFMCIDISNFYLNAPLIRFEYMKIPLSIFPAHIVQQYNLPTKAKNGFVYLEVRNTIWGLPCAGAVSNALLKKRLAPKGYYEVPHTPGLWKHISRPISFSLVVDDFGVKYEGKEHVKHLIAALKEHYTISEDWTGGLYCGIKLEWNYAKQLSDRYVELSMPGYIEKVLTKYNHPTPKKPVNTPYRVAPKKFGTAAQTPREPDNSPSAGEEGIKFVQQRVGSLLYYSRGVDSTPLTALSTIGSEQAHATEKTVSDTKHLLDYLATNPNAKIRYYASEMILNVHSDASYLSESRARSRASGRFFLGSLPQPNEPIKLNGPIHDLCVILQLVAASAAEAELGALFLNTAQAKIIRLILEELGHPQPPTPIHCDNLTAVGIVNDTVKKQRSRAMEMRYFWVCDQVKNGHVKVYWYPGLENLADYSKHHEERHHVKVRPIYLHMQNSPRTLMRAPAPSVLRGCVGIKARGYARGRPMPTIPIASTQAAAA